MLTKKLKKILPFFTAHQGLGFYYIIYTALQCGSAAPQPALWGGPGPRYKPEPGGPEAGMLTTRPPHLYHHLLII